MTQSTSSGKLRTLFFQRNSLSGHSRARDAVIEKVVVSSTGQEAARGR